MFSGQTALRAAVLACGLAWAGAAFTAPVDAAGDADRAARWVQGSGDHSGRPFAIVDKQTAQLLVYTADGRLAGASAALTGQARGDHALPGTGSKPLSQISVEERTTPAGRFAAEPGRNLDGEDIVWLDYDAGLAIHRLRSGRAQAARARSLASTTPADNRATLGCVVVPVAFYEQVVQPLLGQQRGVVYVLPETRPLSAFLGQLQQAAP